MTTPPPSPSPPPTSWTLEIVLGVAGGFCALTAFGMPQSKLGALLATLLFGLLLWSVALFRVLRRRQPTALRNDGEPPMAAAAPALYRMLPGRTYEVQQDFTDHARQTFRRGERLVFRKRHFLPYHDGHTLVFDGRVVQLQGDEQRALIDGWGALMVPLRQHVDPPVWPPVDAALRGRVDALIADPDGPSHPDPAHEQAARAASRALHEAVWDLPVDDLFESMDDGIGRLCDTMDRETPWLGAKARGALIHSFVMNRR